MVNFYNKAYAMILNKKLVFIFLFLSVAGLVQASDDNTYPFEQSQRECVLSSICVGGIIGAVCGFLDRKSVPLLYTWTGGFIASLRANDKTICPDVPNVSSMPLIWLGSCVARHGIIVALHHERGSSQKTIGFAHDVAFISSWISWAVVTAIYNERLGAD